MGQAMSRLPHPRPATRPNDRGHAMPDDAPTAGRTCSQTVAEGDDCCASDLGVCAGTAAWEHAASGALLCEVHAKNAQLLGGAQLGYWVVGETRTPYPDGWTRIEDGAPIEVPSGGASLLRCPPCPRRCAGLAAS